MGIGYRRLSITPAAVGQQTINNKVLQAGIILQLKGHAKVGTGSHPEFSIFQPGAVNNVTMGTKLF